MFLRKEESGPSSGISALLLEGRVAVDARDLRVWIEDLCEIPEERADLVEMRPGMATTRLKSRVFILYSCFDL